jgi:hypothetical protein
MLTHSFPARAALDRRPLSKAELGGTSIGQKDQIFLRD